jgi:hypothetical protein
LRERCGKHLGRDRRVVNAARLETDPQGFQSGTQLRLMKTFGGELGARRQRGERENIHDDAALDIELDRRLNAAERECRIGRQARFHHRGFGNAELVIGGLQPFVVQKRDADGAVPRAAARACASPAASSPFTFTTSLLSSGATMAFTSAMPPSGENAAQPPQAKAGTNRPKSGAGWFLCGARPHPFPRAHFSSKDPPRGAEPRRRLRDAREARPFFVRPVIPGRPKAGPGIHNHHR